MSISFGEKVRAIRESEGLKRPAFCALVDVPSESLRKIESGTRNPSVEVAEKICKAFPRYTLWLMTSSIDHEEKQIFVELKD